MSGDHWSSFLEMVLKTVTPTHTINPPVWFCSSSVNPEKIFAATADVVGPINWVFFSQDFLKFKYWERTLGDRFHNISISTDLKATTFKLREPFRDLMTKMGREQQSTQWWSSQIATRNTLDSSLFLYCSYLHLALELLKKESGPMCIICESPSILESLAVSNPKRVIWIERPSKIRQNLWLWLRRTFYIFRVTFFVIRGKIFSQRYPPLNANRPTILIYTYVEESCFGKDGVFHDRYYPGLAKWLESRGFNVVTIPYLYTISSSFRVAWRWFRRSNQNFIDPYAYYRLSDLFHVLRLAIQSARLPMTEIILSDLDVTRLFLAEQKRYAFTSLDIMLYLRLPKRLAASDFAVDQLICEYEGMTAERMLLIGFKEYYPNIRTVGYHHGSVSPMLLCNFLTAEESQFAPLQDRIICNGSYFRDLFIKEGLPADKLVVGPALRYRHLYANNGFQPTKAPLINTVLVPLPLMTSDGAELLYKVLSAFEKNAKYQFIIKPHPMAPENDVLLTEYGIDKLPNHFEFSRKNMFEWLPRVQAVVSMSSSVVHEVAAAGVPLVVVGRDAALELNPLGFFPDRNQVFYTPQQICQELKRLMNLSPEKKQQYQVRAEEILNLSFNSVTEAFLETFILCGSLIKKNTDAYDSIS